MPTPAVARTPMSHSHHEPLMKKPKKSAATRKTQTSLRMSEDTLNLARRKADEKGTTMSNVIRSALRLYCIVDDLPQEQLLGIVDKRTGQVLQAIFLTD